MADDGQQLLLTFDAKFERYLRNFERAQQQTDKRFRVLEKSAKTASDRMESAFAKAGVGIRNTVSAIGGAFASFVSARAVQDLIDSSIKIENQLKTTGLAGKDLTDVYDALFASAQKNATPLEALVTLYSRTSGAAKELGANQQDLLRFSDGIALAMRVSGQSAGESAGALLQLSQALGGGKIQAEEYNSLLDAGRPILQAVAAGMTEAGGSVSKLTALVKDGKVSSEAFFRAFLAGLPVLQSQVAGSESTISSSFVRLQNVLTDAARRFNESGEASRQFSAIVDRVAAEIAAVNFDNLVQQIMAVTDAVSQSIATLDAWAAKLGSISGLSGIGKALVNSLPGDTTVKSYLGGALTVTSPDAVQDRIDGAFGIPASGQSGLSPNAIRDFAERSGAKAGAAAAKASRLPAAAPVEAVKPVSLADYPIAESASSGKGRSRSGGGGHSRDSFASELQQLQQRTTALQAVTAAQAALNPLMDDYGAAMATVEAKQQLLNAAAQQNRTITPQMATQIDAAAQAYGRATAAAAQLQDEQQKVKQAAEEAMNVARDVTRGFITDLMNGKSGAEAFSNALAKVGDAILNNILDKVFQLDSFGGLFGGLFGGGGGSQLGLAASGAIFGLFDDGGYTGDGGKHEPAGVVHRGEVVWSQADVRRAGGVATVEAMRLGKRGYADGGHVRNAPALRKPNLQAANGNAPQAAPVTITSNVTVNAQGGDPAANADLAAKVGKQVENQMRVIVQQEMRSAMRPGGIMMGRR